MGKSLSLDIRDRVVVLVDEGLSCQETARRLRISAASAVRIIQRKKRTGGVTAARQGRPRRSKLDAVSDWLKMRGRGEARHYDAGAVRCIGGGARGARDASYAVPPPGPSSWLHI